MDIKVKKNGLIKLPQEVMDELYIEEGDLLSIQIENDKIILSETTAYPKKFYRFLADKAMELKKNHDKYGIGTIQSEEEMLKGIMKMMEIEEKKK